MLSFYEKRYEYSFTWKIENFSMCIQKPGEFFYSPVFIVDSLNGSKFKIVFYPKGRDTTGYISCFLENHDLNTEDITIDFKFECIGKNRKVLRSVKDEKQFTIGSSYGIDAFWSHTELYKEKENLLHDTLTIRCSINTGTEKRLNIEACTEIGVDQYSSLWKVNHENISGWTESKTFHITKGISLRTTLACPESDILISIQRLNNRPPSTKCIKCKITLLDIQGVGRKYKTDSHQFGSKDHQWQLPNFITKSDIQDEVNMFLKNGIFTLAWEFSVPNGIMKETIGGITEYKLPSEEYVYTFESTPTLVEDFQNLLLTEKYSDVQLKIGDIFVPAHKLVLSARSSVFSAMFENDTTESQNCIVNIKNLELDTLRYLLKFMYTVEIDVKDYESVKKLFLASYKYQL